MDNEIEGEELWEDREIGAEACLLGDPHKVETS
jgi:hypothetical protein